MRRRRQMIGKGCGCIALKFCFQGDVLAVVESERASSSIQVAISRQALGGVVDNKRVIHTRLFALPHGKLRQTSYRNQQEYERPFRSHEFLQSDLQSRTEICIQSKSGNCPGQRNSPSISSFLFGISADSDSPEDSAPELCRNRSGWPIADSDKTQTLHLHQCIPCQTRKMRILSTAPRIL